MILPDSRQIVLQCYIRLARIDLILLFALTLCVVAAVVWFDVMLQAYGDQRELALLEQQLQQRASASQSQAGQDNATEPNLKAFYKVLPARSEAEQNIAKLFALAKQEDISLEQGEYRLSSDSTVRTYRYQMFFPVKAPYAVIRRFCEMALVALPSLSLDELTFKRASTGDQDLEATLRFSLFLTDQQPVQHAKVKSE